MIPVLSCAWTTGLMTEYLEGALPAHRLAGVKLHLGICPRCRAFLASLRSLPALVRDAFADEPMPHALSGTLDKALARIRSGETQSPALHPSETLCAALSGGTVDASTRMLLEAHLDRCAPCRRAHPDHVPSLPDSGALPLSPRLREGLRPESAWKWVRHGLRGARVAEVFRDPRTQASLWLAYLPTGASFPAHRHWDQEASVILDGWIQDGPHLAGPGDYLQHDLGSEHAPKGEGRDGCWLLSRTGPDGMRFKGWRRIFG